MLQPVDKFSSALLSSSQTHQQRFSFMSLLEKAAHEQKQEQSPGITAQATL